MLHASIEPLPKEIFVRSFDRINENSYAYGTVFAETETEIILSRPIFVVIDTE